MEERRASAEDCKWVLEPFMSLPLVQASPPGPPEVSNRVKAAWWFTGSPRSGCSEQGSVCSRKEATTRAHVSVHIIKQLPDEADVTQKL